MGSGGWEVERGGGATEHSRGLRRGQAKQARNIDININLVPRRASARDGEG